MRKTAFVAGMGRNSPRRRGSDREGEGYPFDRHPERKRFRKRGQRVCGGGRILSPAREVAACGAYALANAVEAYIESEETDVAAIYAEKAISLLAKNLVTAVVDGDNAEAVRATALAGTLAGVAYGAVPYGAAHALAEGLHKATGEPLEEMFALTLVPAMKRAREKYEDRIKTLYYLLVGATEYAETPDSERAERAIASVEWLLSSLHASGNLPVKISETKINRELFGAIADEAINKRASITAFGPIGKEEFITMLNDAY